MQKLPYKDLKYQGTCFADSITSLNDKLNTPDDRDYVYYVVYDIDRNVDCKDKTKQISLMPNKGKINDKRLGYRKREKGRARTEKLILDQNDQNEYMVH